ncbi:Tetratricopeptide repeat protein [Candidatus Venteria ishoeyi]|uniref:Tetratricopeptide repeat protein n=2 Tax=Candidatus Venteria ishoeyi TaxID=1899563 RepID=A0A1H6FBJ3_9GAMM|nr:Tetratricopeptide repeat protein [Candidatus Venteria ishoeyi]
MVPDNIHANTEYGLALVESQDYNSAINYLDKVVSLDSNFNVCNVQMARCTALENLSHYPAALFALHKAMSDNASDVSQVNKKLEWQEIRLLLKNNDYNDALNILVKMPLNPETYACRSFILVHCGRAQEAADLTQQWLRKPSDRVAEICNVLATSAT